jgi:ankyrin repeat protein
MFPLLLVAMRCKNDEEKAIHATQFLLDNGANENQKTNLGQTALTAAVEAGSLALGRASR